MAQIIHKSGAEFLVNTVTIFNQTDPAITRLANGSFVVSWADQSGGQIKSQLFDASGARIGGEFLVNTETAGTQGEPTITSLAGGGFVVSWTDGSLAGGDASISGVKAQTFDATGARVGAEFLVNTQTLNSQLSPTITGLTNGGFVVSWTDNGGVDDASRSGIKAQIFDAAGAMVSAEFLVNTSTAFEQFSPTITSLAGGGFVVSWTDNSFTGGDGSNHSIKAQIFDAAGARIGAEFLVNTQTASYQNQPTITSLAGGGFVISWTDESRAAADTDATSIRVQVFDATGAKLGAEFVANTVTLSFQNEPTIAGLAGGGFVISWVDSSQTGGDTSNRAIKAQVFDATGVKVGTELLVNTGTANIQNQPTVTGLGDGGFVISWTDGSFTGGDTSGTSIKAQIFRIEEINSDPVAADDHIAGTTEDTALAIPAGMLLANDTDADASDVLTVLSVSNGIGGTPVLNPDGSITFVPAADFNGAASFEYVVADGRGGTATATVSFSVAPVNDAPEAVAIADAVSPANQAVSVIVPSFTDVDGDVLSYAAALADGSALPAWLSFDAVSRTFSGTPPAGFSGALELAVTASDGTASASGSFTLTITPSNSPPVGSDDAFGAAGQAKIHEGTETVIDVTDLLLNDIDPDGDALSFDGIVSTTSLGSLSVLTENGRTYVAYTYTGASLAENATTADSFTYRLRDPSGALATATVSLTVTGLANTLIRGTNRADILSGGDLSHDTILARNGKDTAFGNRGNDKLFGGIGNDQLHGGEGSDAIDGGRGGDLLNGGLGNDTLTGRREADAFVFGENGSIANTGLDRVTDFKPGTDAILLGAGISVVSAAVSRIDDNDQMDTTLTLSNGGQIQVMDVNGLSTEDWAVSVLWVA